MSTKVDKRLGLNPVRQCSVLFREDALYFGKHEDPPSIAWTAVTSVSVSVAEATDFPILDIPVFGDLSGSANRLCPRIVYHHPRLGEQSLDVPELGAYLTRTGMRRVESRAAVLAARAGVQLAPTTPLEQLRTAIKEQDRLATLPRTTNQNTCARTNKGSAQLRGLRRDPS